MNETLHAQAHDLIRAYYRALDNEDLIDALRLVDSDASVYRVMQAKLRYELSTSRGVNAVKDSKLIAFDAPFVFMRIKCERRLAANGEYSLRQQKIEASDSLFTLSSTKNGLKIWNILPLTQQGEPRKR